MQKSFPKIKSMQIDIWSTFLSVISLEKSQSQMIFKAKTFSWHFSSDFRCPSRFWGSWFKSCQSQFSPLFPPIIGSLLPTLELLVCGNNHHSSYTLCQIIFLCSKIEFWRNLSINLIWIFAPKFNNILKYQSLKCIKY